MYKALAFLLLAIPAFAADAPAIKLMTPGIAPVTTIPPPPKLKVDDFQWFKLDNYSGLTTWEIEGDAAIIHELAKPVQRIDWTDASKPPVVTDLPAGVLLVRGMKPGEVKLSAWGVVENRAKRLATIVLTVEGARPPPDLPVPPIDKPTPKEGIYFLIVQADGPTTPSMLDALKLPAWGELTKAGHTYKPVSFTEARKLGATIPDGTALPCVLPLRIAADGKSSKEIPPPLKFPTDNDAVRKLMEVAK